MEVHVSLAVFEHISKKGRSALDRLNHLSMCRSVSLDIRHKSLLLHGKPQDAQRVKRSAASLLQQPDQLAGAQTDELFPVCLR